MTQPVHDAPVSPLRQRLIDDMTSLALARELLAVAPPPHDDTPQDPIDVRPPCPCCGGRMIVIAAFARWRQPRTPPPTPEPTGSLHA